MALMFLIFILMLAPVVRAETKIDNSASMRVMIIDKNIKKSNFPSHVKFDERKPKKMSFSREDRERKLEKLKLSSHVTRLNMDELDRDLLYMDLKNNSIDEILSAYPGIPAETLQYAKIHFSR